MNSKIYDVLKNISQIILPALATFYLTLAGRFNVTYKYTRKINL